MAPLWILSSLWQILSSLWCILSSLWCILSSLWWILSSLWWILQFFFFSFLLLIIYVNHLFNMYIYLFICLKIFISSQPPYGFYHSSFFLFPFHIFLIIFSFFVHFFLISYFRCQVTYKCYPGFVHKGQPITHIHYFFLSPFYIFLIILSFFVQISFIRYLILGEL